MGKGLLGPNGGSGRLIEGRFGERRGGNGGRGCSISRVGEGKVDSIGGMGGGSLSIRLMVLNDGRGGEGLVVKGGSYPRESRKALGEVGGVENKSSMRSRLMANGDDIEAIENVVENESHFSLEVVDDGLSPNDGSGGLIEGRFGKRCDGNGGRSGSMSEVGEGKVDLMVGIGGGSLTIHLMVSNDGRGGGGLVVEGGIGAGGGEVNGGGVDLGVSKRLPLEVAGEMIGESGRIDVGEVGRGADT
ncbi:hypothetical protein Tco_0381823 [Tanacetum coccineum]